MLIYMLSGLINVVDAAPYTLPITRNNKEKTMVAADWWGGEYPSPIIEVSSKESTVAVYGYASLRKPTEKKKCTIPVGLYHPWTKDKLPVETYYTIIPHAQYEVTKDNPELNLKKGDFFDMEVGIGENFCSYLHVSGKTRVELTEDCDLPVREGMRAIKPASHPTEQWLYLKCNEGYKIFIQDQDLLKQTGNKEGQICGYGYIAKKDQACPME